MWRPVTLSGNRLSLMATSGLDRWPSKTELGLQTSLTILWNCFGQAELRGLPAFFMRKRRMYSSFS